MTATLEQARDEITKLFVDAWKIDPVARNYVIAYDDRSDPHVNSPKPWCRITIRHSAGQQHSLGGFGKRVFNRSGIAIVQVFVPFGQGLLLQDQLSTVARKAFEGKRTLPGNVWFRNVNTVEAGSSGAYSQINVSASFTYDELV
jgi:hypothetical protein